MAATWHKPLSCRPAKPDVMASWYVGARATPALCQVVLLHPSSFLEWQKELGGKGLLEVSGLLLYLKHDSFQNFRMAVWALCKVSGFPALTLYVCVRPPDLPLFTLRACQCAQIVHSNLAWPFWNCGTILYLHSPQQELSYIWQMGKSGDRSTSVYTGSWICT